MQISKVVTLLEASDAVFFAKIKNNVFLFLKQC